MNFEQFCLARGFDHATLNDAQRAFLTAAFQAASNPPPVAQPVPAASHPPPLPSGGYDAARPAIDAETARVEAIRSATTRTAEANIGNSEKIKQLWALCDAAIADKTCTLNKFELDLLRLDRTAGPVIISTSRPKMTSEVIEAALCRTIGIKSVEKDYDEQTLEASHKQFRRGISLKELLQVAAERNNGYRGSVSDTTALCKSAFKTNDGDGRLAVGPSTIDVPDILSNVANKGLDQAFLNTEQAWRLVGRMRNLKDFKTATQMRLGGDTEFEIIPSGGKIKHGELEDASYTLKAESYGIMLGIDYQQIRNDDLGAFADLQSIIGRGAGDKINKVFWTDNWLAAQSTYFPTNDSNSNYFSGAATVLSLAGLDLGEAKFRRQTKEDGVSPLGEIPRVLLVPATLANTAAALMQTTGLVVGTTPASGPNVNVFAGRYTVASSAYLDGTSTVIWWLLADPNSIPVIQIGFLDGIDRPMVESSEFDFSQLGLAMRGTLHFGVGMAEYRGGVKSKGAS